MDSAGHYSRPELLSLVVDRTPRPQLHEHIEQLTDIALEEAQHAYV